MNDNFLLKLQKEAAAQKKLNEKRIFPESLDSVTSFIGVYAWQTVLVCAVVTALVWEWWF